MSEPTAFVDGIAAEVLDKAGQWTVEKIDAITAPDSPITLKPQEYAIATFATPRAVLEVLKARYATVAIDCSTTEGEEAAKEARYKLRTLRTRTEKLRLTANTPYAEQIKANKAIADMIEDEIRPLESRFDEAIKKREAEREADRKRIAAQRAEKEAAINREIAAIDAEVSDAIDKPSATIYAAIVELTALVVESERLGERFKDVVTAKDRAIEKLNAMHTSALEREERQRKAQEERAAFEARETARERIATHINQPVMAQFNGTPESINALLDDLNGMQPEQFAPLAEDAAKALEAGRVTLRSYLIAAVDREQQAKERQADIARAAEEAVKRTNEQRARARIEAAQAYVTETITGDWDSESIGAIVAVLKDVQPETFAPFEDEGMAAVKATITAMTRLFEQRLAREQEQAAKDEEQRLLDHAVALNREREQTVVDTFVRIGNSFAFHETAGTGSVELASFISKLEAFPVPEEVFGEREMEFRELLADQLGKLRGLMHGRKVAEDAAAEKKRQDDAEAAEKVRKAAEEKAAREEKDRADAALRDNAMRMFEALRAVIEDPNYAALDDVTRTMVRESLTF